MSIPTRAGIISFSLFVLLAQPVFAQSVPSPSEARPRRDPPPQAYEDCRGKKAGDKVMHTTPEGVVDATCEDSPKGLVARPIRPPEDSRESRPPEGQLRKGGERGQSQERGKTD